MLDERVVPWTEMWKREGLEAGRKEGIQQGIQQGQAAERDLLVRLARKRFDEPCAQALAPLLEDVDDPEDLAQIGELILTCDTGAELIAKVRG